MENKFWSLLGCQLCKGMIESTRPRKIDIDTKRIKDEIINLNNYCGMCQVYDNPARESWRVIYQKALHVMFEFEEKRKKAVYIECEIDIEFTTVET